MKIKVGVLLVLAGLLSFAFLSRDSSMWQTVRFGIAARFRGETDYDALDRERRTSEAVEVPGTADVVWPTPYWTDFLGPGRSNVYDEGPLLEPWPDGGPPELWRVRVGPAYSSVVVADGLAFTMEQRRELEVVVAFDLESGREVWTHGWEARHFDSLSKEGPRATPVYARGAVIAQGATGELRKLDAGTGELVWRTDLLDAPGAESLLYGLSGTPLVLDDLVIAQGGEAGSGGGVMAFDFESGELRWHALGERMTYASPQPAELLGRTMVLVITAARIVGLEPTTGAELWSAPWHVSNDLSCTQPLVVAPNRVLLSAGYGKGSQLFELVERDNRIEATSLWRSARFKTRFNNSVLVDGFAYGLDEGVLACIDVADGRRMWKSGSYGLGQLLLAGERLLVVTEDGEVVLLDIDGEEGVELHRFQALESTTINPPCLAHGRLLVRNHEELVCYDLRPVGVGSSADESRDG